MDGRPNRRNKAAFSNPSGVVQREGGGGLRCRKDYKQMKGITKRPIFT